MSAARPVVTLGTEYGGHWITARHVADILGLTDTRPSRPLDDLRNDDGPRVRGRRRRQGPPHRRRHQKRTVPPKSWEMRTRHLIGDLPPACRRRRRGDLMLAAAGTVARSAPEGRESREAKRPLVGGDSGARAAVLRAPHPK